MDRKCLNFFFKVGNDGGRHGWYKWSHGSQPSGTSMTHSISLYDCMLVSVVSGGSTPEYSWSEPQPCSDRVTRVLCKCMTNISNTHLKCSAVIMAEESDPVLLKAVLWLQERQEMLKEGFCLDFRGNNYIFVPTFIDR